MAPFPLDIVNLRKGATPEIITRFLNRNGLPTKGEDKRPTKFGCTITIGLKSEDDRIRAGKLMSNKILEPINAGKPIRLGVVWPLPKGACVICYNPQNPDNFSFHRRKRSQGKTRMTCPNAGSVCITCKDRNHSARQCGYEEERTYAVARTARGKVKAEPTPNASKGPKTPSTSSSKGNIGRTTNVSKPRNLTPSTGSHRPAKAPNTATSSTGKSSRSSRSSNTGEGFSSEEEGKRKYPLPLHNNLTPSQVNAGTPMLHASKRRTTHRRITVPQVDCTVQQINNNRIPTKRVTYLWIIITIIAVATYGMHPRKTPQSYKPPCKNTKLITLIAACGIAIIICTTPITVTGISPAHRPIPPVSPPTIYLVWEATNHQTWAQGRHKPHHKYGIHPSHSLYSTYTNDCD